LKFSIFGTKAITAQAPPWSDKGMIIKKYHKPSAPNQKLQQQKLMRAAYGLYDRNLSRAQFIMAIKPMISGPIPGSITPERRRQNMHAATEAKIQGRAIVSL